MPQDSIPPQPPQQFLGQQSPVPGNNKVLLIVGIVAMVVIAGLFVAMVMFQGPGSQPVPVSPLPAVGDPVEEVSEGTTISDIEADLNALESEIVLPDLDAETRALELETEEF